MEAYRAYLEGSWAVLDTSEYTTSSLSSVGRWVAVAGVVHELLYSCEFDYLRGCSSTFSWSNIEHSQNLAVSKANDNKTGDLSIPHSNEASESETEEPSSKGHEQLRYQ